MTLPTRTARRTSVSSSEKSRVRRVAALTRRPPTRATNRTAGAATMSPRAGSPAYTCPRPGKSRERKLAAKADRRGAVFAVALTTPMIRPLPRGGAHSAGCDTSSPERASPERSHAPARLEPSRPARPRARDARALAGAPHLRTPARAAARGPTVELPRRADHREQPDGRAPRLGARLQGPVPALPRHARGGPALPERLRLPGPVGRGERRARSRLHEQARHRSPRHRSLRQPVQAARPDLRRPADRAVDPPWHVDGLGRSPPPPLPP